MLDFGAEVFQQARKFDVPIVSTKYLFVTHSHADHFYPTHLFWRGINPDQKLPPDEKNILGPRFLIIPARQREVVEVHKVLPEKAGR